MAIQTRDYLKGKYETGDKPQAQDYADWIDSYVHKTEHGVSNAIAPGGGTVVIAAGELVDKLIITSASSQNVSVGTSSGGTEVINAAAITAGGYLVWTEDFYANGSPVTLYITCTGAVTVLLRKTIFA